MRPPGKSGLKPSRHRPKTREKLDSRPKKTSAPRKTSTAAPTHGREPEPAAKNSVKPQRRALSPGPSSEMVAPIMLTASEFSDYELIDCGFGEKLERYGPYLIVRPEGQALFQPSLEIEAWQRADAVFAGVGEDDDKGRWRFQNQLKTAALEDAWPIRFRDVSFHARFTAFRHMGFFAEQAAHWDWISNQIRLAGRPIKVLNLFGYTGVASLVAAAAGASVTHVDASKKAIGWARENQTLSGLGDAPIRWICDDAAKFVAREARRDNAYDAIIMDPPKYGRGPKGEVWHYFDDLPELMHLTRSILSRTPLFFLLSSYAIRASYLASHELARDVFSGLGGKIESGELLINQAKSDRSISTSLYTRWHNGEVQNG